MWVSCGAESPRVVFLVVISGMSLCTEQNYTDMLSNPGSIILLIMGKRFSSLPHFFHLYCEIRILVVSGGLNGMIHVKCRMRCQIHKSCPINLISFSPCLNGETSRQQQLD